MAIAKTINQPIKREERTDEVVIQAPLGAGYIVRVLRVTRDYFADAPPVEVARRWLSRSMQQLMLNKAALPLIGSLPPTFDRWAQEDDDRASARNKVLADLAVAQAALGTASAAMLASDTAESAAQVALTAAQASLNDVELTGSASVVAAARADVMACQTSYNRAHTTAVSNRGGR